jgi:hypothetical protein
MLPHIPSLYALESKDEGPLSAELLLVRLRSQVAVVRTLTDQVERLSRPRGTSHTSGLGEQFVEEAVRLGYRLLEAAASIAAAPRSEASGVFAMPQG